MRQRFVRPGPLVLGTAPIKYPAPTTDRDRTVSRRSEPSSRTALIGEQPNPSGPNTAPGCDEPTSRCQTSPSMWTLGGDQPVIPRVTFIRLSDGISTHIPPVTNSNFRSCSTRQSRSQARFCVCTLSLDFRSSRATFERLRYSFGGDRPSQTAHLTMSPSPLQGCWLEFQYHKDGIPTSTPQMPKHLLPCVHLSCAYNIETQYQATVKLHGVFPSCRG